MPAQLIHPGIYTQEMPGDVPGIAAGPTSVAAFVGTAPRGPLDRALRLSSFADYERGFGGLAADSEMSHAVRLFFLNGGGEAWAVRVAGDTSRAGATLAGASGAAALRVDALDAGSAGNAIQVRVQPPEPAAGDGVFTLCFSRLDDGAQETYRNVAMEPAGAHRAVDLVNAGSRLVRLTALAAEPPAPTTQPLAGGAEAPLAAADLHAVFIGDRSAHKGLYALDEVEPFNILCLPGMADAGVLRDAAAYCEERRAFLIVDSPPTALTAAQMRACMSGGGLPDSDHAAVFFPWMLVADPLQNGQPRLTPPSGAVAGVHARTDANRGIWKAPAGVDATLAGVPDLACHLDDTDNDGLNRLGVNCLRTFSRQAPVCWGARTLRGADAIASEYKYIAVRRVALWLESSVRGGLQWTVFEPNDEALWARVRLTVAAFLQGLFRQGAFQGTTARDAYRIQCDAGTTTPADIAAGVVNILVGFAPLRPCEFVQIRIQQAAGRPQP